MIEVVNIHPAKLLSAYTHLERIKQELELFHIENDMPELGYVHYSLYYNLRQVVAKSKLLFR